MGMEATGRDQGKPLCVDLDGTLINTNMLVETAIAGLLRNPLLLFRLPFWLMQGRAVLKQKLAADAPIDVGTLPYNMPLLELLAEEKQSGRTLVLVTAADQAIARPIASHLALFSEVIASDGSLNLRGTAKQQCLVERFGEKGFSYAGNDHSDFAIWDKADQAIIVNGSAALRWEARRRYGPCLELVGGNSRSAAFIKALRPHQWVKNILVLVPMMAVGDVANLQTWSQAILAFLALCLTASGVYVGNDLMDLSADRAHHRKRSRPFAHGDLSLSTARGYMHDDPIVYAAKDWVSWCVAAVMGIIILAARLLPPGTVLGAVG